MEDNKKSKVNNQCTKCNKSFPNDCKLKRHQNRKYSSS